MSFAEESLSLQRARLRASAKLSPKARGLHAYHQRRDLASAWLVDPGTSPETRIYRHGVKRVWIRNSDGLKVETDVCVFDTLTGASRAGRFRREELGLGNDAPGRSAHDALSELRAQCTGLNINWILDADLPAAGRCEWMLR